MDRGMHVQCPLRKRAPNGNYLRGHLTAEKIARDAARLKKYARFIIVLGADGEVLSIADNNHGKHIASVIAVLGPSMVSGELIPETLLLEAGLSQGRPYCLAERTKRQKLGKGKYQRLKRVYLVSRRRVRTPTIPERRSILPVIANIALEEITAHVRSKWQPFSRKGWWVPGLPTGKLQAERGVQVTVHESDEWLWKAFLCHCNSYRYSKYVEFSFPMSWVGRFRFKGRGKNHGHGNYEFEYFFRKEARELFDL